MAQAVAGLAISLQHMGLAAVAVWVFMVAAQTAT
jgi:hypothetical protein